MNKNRATESERERWRGGGRYRFIETRGVYGLAQGGSYNVVPINNMLYLQIIKS